MATEADYRERLVDPSTGFWEVDVPADAIIRVTIPSIRFEKLFRVPNDPAITLLNIRDARIDPGPGGEIGITSDTGLRDGYKGVS